MKRNITVVLVVLIAVVFSLPGYSYTSPNKSKELKLETFNGWNKLDLKSKNQWRIWKKGGSAPEASLNIIIKTTVDIKKKQKKILKSAGFRYNSVVNNIATGSIYLADMEKLAALDFVEVVEAAVALHNK